MIAIILGIVLSFLGMGANSEQPVTVIPPKRESVDVVEFEWAQFHADAFEEYADEFTAIFNAIEFKVSKNGRSMIRRPGDKGFRFVKSA